MGVSQRKMNMDWNCLLKQRAYKDEKEIWKPSLGLGVGEA